MRKLKIALVTSDRRHCGIREYGKFLLQALQGDPDLEITEFPNPDSLQLGAPDCDIIHINHHAALHSSWTKERVKEYQKHWYVVTVTQHDSFETFEIMQERGFQDFRAADGLVVHEPVAGLTNVSTDAWAPNVHYIPQGVLPAQEVTEVAKKTVATFGFDFPWKNFDALARISKEAGWAMLLISPGMEQRRVEEIKEINPDALVITSWLKAEDIVFMLGSSTATAFLYSTGNSGTSGAIRLGVAARRPMIAFSSRQNRDIQHEQAIRWVENEKVAAAVLQSWGFGNAASEIVMKGRTEGMKELAERQSWTSAAKQYKAMWLQAWEEKN